MSKPRLCEYCRHPIGKHSHLDIHPCNEDGCTCGAFEGLVSHNIGKDTA